jgi:hypothetical protein
VKHFVSLLRARHRTTTPYHPRTNGKVEKVYAIDQEVGTLSRDSVFPNTGGEQRFCEVFVPESTTCGCPLQGKRALTRPCHPETKDPGLRSHQDQLTSVSDDAGVYAIDQEVGTLSRDSVFPNTGGEQRTCGCPLQGKRALTRPCHPETKDPGLRSHQDQLQERTRPFGSARA